MSIGNDIKEVFAELGSPVIVYKRASGEELIEYIDYEINLQASSPFVTQFIINATFPFDTQAEAGDVIQFHDDGTYFIAASFNKDRFEQAVVVNELILYRCNTAGDLERLTTLRNPDTLKLDTMWVSMVKNEPVLLTGMIDSHRIVENEHSFYSIPGLNLHISGNVDIEVGDRFKISGQKPEVYIVKAVEPRRLNNLTMCRVTPDKRG